MALEAGTFQFDLVAYNEKGMASTDSMRITVAEAGLITPTPSVPVSMTSPPALSLTPTPMRAGFCAGGTGATAAATVVDLIVCLNITRGLLPLDACPAADINGDGLITVDELLRVVNAAQGGR